MLDFHRRRNSRSARSYSLRPQVGLKRDRVLLIMMVLGACVLLMMIRHIMTPGFQNTLTHVFRIAGGDMPIESEADPFLVIPDDFDRSNMPNLVPGTGIINTIDEASSVGSTGGSEPLIPDSAATVDTAVTPDTTVESSEDTPDVPADIDTDEMTPEEIMEVAVEEEPISEEDRRRAEEEGFVPGIRPSLFDEVRDNMPFQAGEAAAFKNLLAVIKGLDEETLKKYLVGRVSHLELYRQPNAMRARLIRVEGVIHRAVPIYGRGPDGNPVVAYYQCWLFADQDPDKSIVVYTLALPENFPTGMTIEEPAAAEGFFFKRWLHKGKPEAGDEEVPLFASPLILSKTIEWYPIPFEETPEGEEQRNMKEIVTAFLAVFVLVAIFVLWTFVLRSRRSALPKAEVSVAPRTWDQLERLDGGTDDSATDNDETNEK